MLQAAFSESGFDNLLKKKYSLKRPSSRLQNRADFSSESFRHQLNARTLDSRPELKRFLSHIYQAFVLQEDMFLREPPLLKQIIIEAMRLKLAAPLDVLGS